MTRASISAHFQRAMILHEQRRYDDAERELRLALASDPSNAEMHAMLALCLAELKRLPEATEEAKQAVGLGPDNPFTHYALAQVLAERNRPEEALTAINQALGLNPHNPSYLSLLAAIYYNLRQWPAALQAAERGLAVDPEHERCINIRAMALVNLGRREEAGAAIGAALQRNPEDPLTHANQGWTCLHKGDHRQAMVHFREALRLDPQLQWARAGMVESLKARNPIYKIMLAYFLFMGRLSRRAQWGIVMGGFIGIEILQNFARNNPGLAPFTLPLILLYSAFAIMTWVADPLFNLMLRVDRFGKYALSREQIWAANFTGLTLLIAVALGAMAWSFASTIMLICALGALLFMIPVSAIFKAPMGWPRYVLIAYAAALAGIGGAALSGIIPAVIKHMDEPLWTHSVGEAYLWGALLHQFFANALFGVRVRK
ncbi:MAG TPA: tetratricopeptide repeat protein [Tepidisphaeraceae bacterium]|jgi:tetratricopeptide (TPR) repeat protein|nr:tetratricopeptide repeat protein [Tepidisphaeraceae bacterium]